MLPFDIDGLMDLNDSDDMSPGPQTIAEWLRNFAHLCSLKWPETDILRTVEDYIRVNGVEDIDSRK